MKALPLRWRIIVALIGLALGTTLALTLLARHFLALSLQLQTSVNVEMGSAMTSALALGKENYDSKKRQLQEIGASLVRAASPRPRSHTRRVCNCRVGGSDPADRARGTGRNGSRARPGGLQSGDRSTPTRPRASRLAAGIDRAAFARCTHRGWKCRAYLQAHRNGGKRFANGLFARLSRRRGRRSRSGMRDRQFALALESRNRFTPC